MVQQVKPLPSTLASREYQTEPYDSTSEPFTANAAEKVVEDDSSALAPATYTKELKEVPDPLHFD